MKRKTKEKISKISLVMRLQKYCFRFHSISTEFFCSLFRVPFSLFLCFSQWWLCTLCMYFFFLFVVLWGVSCFTHVQLPLSVPCGCVILLLMLFFYRNVTYSKPNYIPTANIIAFSWLKQTDFKQKTKPT